MTEFGEQVKRSMRIRHDLLDEEIENNIQTCVLLLQGVGISPAKAVYEPEDKLVRKACELYCKWQFDFDGKGDRFQKAYEGLRDFMSLGGDYTAGIE